MLKILRFQSSVISTCRLQFVFEKISCAASSDLVCRSISTLALEAVFRLKFARAATLAIPVFDEKGKILIRTDKCLACLLGRQLSYVQYRGRSSSIVCYPMETSAAVCVTAIVVPPHKSEQKLYFHPSLNTRQETLREKVKQRQSVVSNPKDSCQRAARPLEFGAAARATARQCNNSDDAIKKRDNHQRIFPTRRLRSLARCTAPLYYN